MEREDQDGDDYYGEAKINRKNIFDDDVSVEAAKKIIRSTKFGEGDDEDMEFLDLGSGTAVRFGASRTTPDLSSLATPVPSGLPPSGSLHSFPASLPPPAGGPELKHVPSSLQKGSSHVRSHSLTLSSSKVPGGEGFPKVSMVTSPSRGSTQSLSIEEVVGMGRRATSMDMDQMQTELNQLRKQLLSARRERWTKMPVELTLRRIMKGEPYSLECYRSLTDKLSLLDQAIKWMDGNAITAATLHLRSTVKRSLFQQELLSRPSAARHYLAYLRGHFEHSELLDTLLMLGQTEEAAMVKYRLACSTADPSAKISLLKACLRSHFETDPSLSSEANSLREHIDLLERQMPIEDSDSRAERESRTPIFVEFPRRFSLIDMPLTTTLFYCSLYHYHLQENNLASPLAIKRRHDVPERQYLWTALSARAKAKGWTDIEQLLTAKGWFGGKKMKAAIGFDKVVEILHKFQAPTQIVAKYLELVDDLDIRLTLSRKTGCRKVTIETLVKQKDRPGVEDFARKNAASVEGDYARRVLRDEAIRWK